MRALLFTLLVSFAASAMTPELEVQAGLLTDTKTEGGASGHAFAARGGVDFADRFGLSLRLATVSGGNALEYVSDGDARDPSGLSGWQAMIEGRVHTRGFLQWHAGAAAGLARLVTYQCRCSESYAVHGKAAFGARFSGGLGLHPEALGGISFGLEADVSIWRGLQAPDVTYFLQANPGGGITTAGLTGFVGYRF